MTRSEVLIKSVAPVRCGAYIQPQYGRTRLCSTEDSQCLDCLARELQAQCDALAEEVDRFDYSRPKTREERKPEYKRKKA